MSSENITITIDFYYSVISQVNSSFLTTEIRANKNASQKCRKSVISVEDNLNNSDGRRAFPNKLKRLDMS